MNASNAKPRAFRRGSSHTLYMLVAMGERSAGEPQATARVRSARGEDALLTDVHLVIVHFFTRRR